MVQSGVIYQITEMTLSFHSAIPYLGIYSTAIHTDF